MYMSVNWIVIIVDSVPSFFLHNVDFVISEKAEITLLFV